MWCPFAGWEMETPNSPGRQHRARPGATLPDVCHCQDPQFFCRTLDFSGPESEDLNGSLGEHVVCYVMKEMRRTYRDRTNCYHTLQLEFKDRNLSNESHFSLHCLLIFVRNRL